MTNIIGRILGSDKAIEFADKHITRAEDGIDKAILTKEERLDYKMAFLKLYEPYKLAQRLLMLILVPVYTFIILVSVALDIASAKFAIFATIADSIMTTAHDTLSTPVGLVVGFYFGGGVIEGVIKKFKDK